ncbi:glycosyltransferase [Catalinimonas niigatensis]|uniref:glycosyltransferase n=1 Tax=Catalinimonas niigatensis TaxID=1397264 RepID=UPI002666CDF6|nr:glycosyltransferase family A protein [Catalinimonas niigatensis]WPP52905.1 glycosyltransferase family A protein [Catalinimonas niigatensis]
MINPFVTIIIPTYNDWTRLNLCLAALANQTYQQEFFEVIVVNNNPNDKLPDSCFIPENCKVINEHKPGSYAARNAALKIAKGEIVGFTDSDCIPDKNWIKHALDFFDQNQEIKRIGGAVNIFFKKKNPSKIELYDKLFAFPQEAYVRSGNAVTANMFTYKYIFDKIGLFNESLMSGGDYQWGMLAHRNSFPIGYAPNAIVKHPARPSIKELVNKAKRVGKGQAKFKSYQEESIYATTVRILKLLKPSLWEIKKVFAKGRDMNLSSKLFLICLRHYIVWVEGFSKVKNERRVRRVS